MIKEKMNNMDNMMAVQEQEAQEALEELRAENLVANHVLRGRMRGAWSSVRLQQRTMLL